MKITLHYDREFGKMTITDGAHEYIVWHSSVLSRYALYQLAETVINLLAGRDRATCNWEEEPGQYRWLLVRDGDDVKISILWFSEAFSRLADERGEIKFVFTCTLRRFAIQLKNALLGELEDSLRGRDFATVVEKLNQSLL